METPTFHIATDPKPKFQKKVWTKPYDKARRDDAYLNRKIVGVDGEGINVLRGPRRGQHDYVLLALGEVAPIIRKDGLRTIEILDYLFENLDPKNLNVIYGGSYDFNCWLADLTRDEVRAVYHSNYDGKPFQYRGYGLRWLKGKSFSITKDGKVVTINDVISFFQRPFIAACDEYLGEYEGRDMLVREKARRGNFRLSELRGIGNYNALELRLLERLVSELRARLDRAGLRPRRWNSPGAIASALFIREKVREHRSENIPKPVAEAARYAYAGGRFEMVKYGAMKEKAYEYDINSAYPRALMEVPSLVGGMWKHWTRKDGDIPHASFALYHVRYENKDEKAINLPAPLFHRAENGTVSYPRYSVNWVWSPEFEVMQEYCEKIPGAKMFTLEAWVYTPATDYKPFGFIGELYKQRQVLKALGDGAHVGIKLGLNSIYGKCAQQVGWRPATETRPLRIPTYHQLEWAGYATSWCRANVLRAALSNPHAVIAFETDALFTSEPLDIQIGTGLGEWEVTEFESLTYVQSGHYYGTKVEKKKGKTVRTEVVKCRGVDKCRHEPPYPNEHDNCVVRENVEARLKLPKPERVLDAKLTRFYGAGISLARDFPNVWRRWLTETKRLNLIPTGKRNHGACWCEGTEFEASVYGVAWHLTYCPIFGTHSSPYPVEWINPNPLMTELAELRESETHYDEWD